jgi:uncharacterized delta-60 repeat protein
LDECRGTALQSDGKLVMVGYIYEGGITPKIAVSRLNTDGTLDNSFNGDGKIITNIGSANEEGKSVVIASDGKIYVSGFHNTGLKYNYALVRYTSTGTEDLTFSTDGIESLSISSEDDIANCMMFQPDGKLLMAGYSGLKSDYGYPLYSNGKISIARYDVNAQSLDPTFNSTGFNTLDIQAGPEQITCMAIQSDGKIVVAGESKSSNSSSSYMDFFVARFNADGTLDNTFGNSGSVVTSIGSRDDKINEVLILPDGKIVVAGYSDNGSNLDIAIAKYSSNGSLDTNFDGDGMKTISIGSYDETVIGLFYDSADGLIVGFRNAINSGDNQCGLLRLKQNGQLDNALGTFLMSLSSGFASERPYAMTTQSDGKIIMVGKSKTNGGNNDFFATRILVPSNLEIHEMNGTTLFSVYPNPTSGIVHLKLDANYLTSNKFEVKLHNSQGQLVYDQSYFGIETFTSSSYDVQIPEYLSPGLYFLSLESEIGKQTCTVILE